MSEEIFIQAEKPVRAPPGWHLCLRSGQGHSGVLADVGGRLWWDLARDWWRLMEASEKSSEGIRSHYRMFLGEKHLPGLSVFLSVCLYRLLVHGFFPSFKPLWFSNYLNMVFISCLGGDYRKIPSWLMVGKSRYRRRVCKTWEFVLLYFTILTFILYLIISSCIRLLEALRAASDLQSFLSSVFT